MSYRWLSTLTLVTSLCAAPALAQLPESPSLAASSTATTTCRLGAGGAVERVIYIQFDNTHLLRDNANVPSDLEQMPHLLEFIRGNGALLANDHTVLISHTAGGILSSLTGVYPDRHGQTVSNSYVRTSTTGAFSFPSSFGYWTDSVSATNTPTVPNMITAEGRNMPAPWVAFTRAGCDVGAIASANIVLENTGTGATGDITKVFGTGSPQWLDAQASNQAPSGSAARAKAQTDFVGFAIHCAQGSPVCANGHDDLLPDEPAGYNGFKGLFGAQEINPFLTSSPIVNDLFAVPITDPFGQPGFPGFDGMSASVTLAYVATMQERGIPITYAYISDAHDFHGVAGNVHTAFGPGDAGYVQQLAEYDRAVAAFFARLAAQGITKANTLFVFTVDEGDHFAGVQKTNCDGVNIPCVYAPNEVGEINANIDTLVGEQFPGLRANFLDATAPYAFTVHGDDAPTFYLARRGAGPLAQLDPLTREFERSAARLTATNPYTQATDPLMVQIADQAGMKALHMIVPADAARNATFVLFADANYFLTDFPTNTCRTCINPAFAWNHGDIQPEIAQTWLGLVGPGVQRVGTSQVWSDHADVRPTILALSGLTDPYTHDGRVLVEALDPSALPPALAGSQSAYVRLAVLDKQLDAPFGDFARAVLAVSTAALKSGNAAQDVTYQSYEQKIAAWTLRRDQIALKMKFMLSKAAFGGQPVDDFLSSYLIGLGQSLLDEVQSFAASLTAG
jgi:hypothetical protein